MARFNERGELAALMEEPKQPPSNYALSGLVTKRKESQRPAQRKPHKTKPSSKEMQEKIYPS